MTEREIYRESFGTDLSFEAELFKTEPETLKIDGVTVSQLFLLPLSLVKNGKVYSAKYVYAVCTKKDSRGKGYMASLLEKLISETEEILILRPSSKGLIDYYNKFGFREFTGTDRDNPLLYALPQERFKDLALLEGETDEGAITLMELGSPTDLEGLSFKYTMP